MRSRKMSEEIFQNPSNMVDQADLVMKINEIQQYASELQDGVSPA